MVSRPRSSHWLPACSQCSSRTAAGVSRHWRIAQNDFGRVKPLYRSNSAALNSLFAPLVSAWGLCVEPKLVRLISTLFFQAEDGIRDHLLGPRNESCSRNLQVELFGSRKGAKE